MKVHVNFYINEKNDTYVRKNDLLLLLLIMRDQGHNLEGAINFIKKLEPEEGNLVELTQKPEKLLEKIIKASKTSLKKVREVEGDKGE